MLFYVNIVVVQQKPFLCQNMVTIFVLFDDLTENDLTPENLKNNFSKKLMQWIWKENYPGHDQLEQLKDA